MKKQHFSFLLLLSLLILALSVPVMAASSSKIKNKMVTKDGVTCYYDSKGKPVKNKLVNYKGKTYYFDAKGELKKDSLFTYKKKTYYARPEGWIAKDSFVKIDGKRYYFNKKGVRVTGWVTRKNQKYYCPASGAIYQDCWKKIGKETYYFTSSYYIARNTWIGDYYVNGSGYRTGGPVSDQGTSTKKVIKMTNIKQKPQLPTGCESVALTMVLKHLGFNLSKTTIASRYLSKSGSNFVSAFWGSPFSSSGGGIYSPGLTITANKYLKAKKSKLKAYDITGSSLTSLYKYIDNGTPVIVWNSMYMRNPYPVYSYRYKGKTWKFFRSEHCVVLCGYDKKEKKFLINDSLSGLVWRKLSSFEKIYNKMGKMAVVIR